ncbi:MAG: M13 family metallopeptidase [Cyclobacteriaceae bacterium]
MGLINNSMRIIALAFLVVALFTISCQESATTQVETIPGLDISQMDTTVNPKADFYQFANGNWLKNTEIPEDEGRWGGFGELRDRNNDLVLDIMNKAAENPEFVAGSDERKAIDFFAVGMDSSLAETVGTQPIKKWLDKIDALESNEEIQGLLAEMHPYGYNSFSGGIGVFPHLKKSDVNALYIGSDGLGLPNRDYYTKEDEKSIEIRNKYVAHIERMLGLVYGEGDFSDMAKQVMSIETQLALATLTPIEQRNLELMYNPMTIAEVQESAPSIDWRAYFDAMGITQDSLINMEPKFITEVSNMFSNRSLDELKAYLRWNTIDQSANYLNKNVVEANFDFYGKVLRGTNEMTPRWERVLGSTNRALGEAIGKVYVAETFPPEAKATAEEMVSDLMKAFEKRIGALEWMSDSTKEQAIAKLNALGVKIGYPDKWRDYAELEVNASGELYSYYDNIENTRKFQFERDKADIGKDVDKSRWGMSPQTVNAYFHPLNNEIVFPAAILQPPFYNYQADAAVNYGAMGAVIGHEISHGFDDSGSRFDANGNMVNWWTSEDKERFEERTALLVAQFDAYEPLDSVNVQGKLTLGENIGDLGGLNAAYDALQLYYERNGRQENIDGFTPEQRFFLSWATIWRTKYRDESLRNQILSDPHSPGMFRAIGPLVNMQTFFDAFDITEGDPLWKADEDRVKIW